MGCKLVVTAGEHKGRYIGLHSSDLRWIPADHPSPQVPVPGTRYSLFAWMQGASYFTQAEAIRIQARLKKKGLDTGLI